jgi:effector-binding domain-containing protein
MHKHVGQHYQSHSKGMIKYEIKRIPKVEGFLMLEYEYITVSKSELENHLKKGWILHRKKYFIFTYLSDFWKGLTTDQKISIIAIITGSVIGVMALI